MSKLLTPKQVKREREKRGLSQKELAELVGYKGASSISYLESGFKGGAALEKVSAYFAENPSE